MKRSGASPFGLNPQNPLAEPETFVVVDDEGRALVLRDPTCASSGFRSYREVQRRGSMFAPSFERAGEIHTMRLPDGTEFIGAVGLSPTLFTATSGAKLIEHLGRGTLRDTREVNSRSLA